jgi:Cytochrome c biogenesis factor
LEQGQSASLKNTARNTNVKNTPLAEYTFHYQGLEFGQGKDYHFVRLKLEMIGPEKSELVLERKAYPAFDNFVAAPVRIEGPLFEKMLLVFGSLNKDNSVVLKVTVYPFIELVWLGAALLCACTLPFAWRFVKGNFKDVVTP